MSACVLQPSVCHPWRKKTTKKKFGPVGCVIGGGTRVAGPKPHPHRLIVWDREGVPGRAEREKKKASGIARASPFGAAKPILLLPCSASHATINPVSPYPFPGMTPTPRARRVAVASCWPVPVAGPSGVCVCLCLCLCMSLVLVPCPGSLSMPMPMPSGWRLAEQTRPSRSSRGAAWWYLDDVRERGGGASSYLARTFKIIIRARVDLPELNYFIPSRALIFWSSAFFFPRRSSNPFSSVYPGKHHSPLRLYYNLLAFAYPPPPETFPTTLPP